MYYGYFDGSSTGSLNIGKVGFLIKDSNFNTIYEDSVYIGRYKTNNRAEYYACLYLIRTALELGIANLRVMGDSLLVVNQVLGKYKINDKMLGLLNQGRGNC